MQRVCSLAMDLAVVVDLEAVVLSFPMRLDDNVGWNYRNWAEGQVDRKLVDSNIVDAAVAVAGESSSAVEPLSCQWRVPTALIYDPLSSTAALHDTF